MGPADLMHALQMEEDHWAAILNQINFLVISNQSEIGVNICFTGTVDPSLGSLHFTTPKILPDCSSQDRQHCPD